MLSVDINVDMGEGYNDKEIAFYASSCNIACGGHYGDETTVRYTIELAKKNNLAIGAHPSYPDKENFGRKSLHMHRMDLILSLLVQTDLIFSKCRDQRVPLHHIKPHGALYNDMAKDRSLTEEVLQAFKTNFPDTAIYGLSGSLVPKVCEELGMTCIQEVFADRAYENATKLMSRSERGALIKKSSAVIKQLDFFLNSTIVDALGNVHPITVETICLHSDTPNAAEIARTIFNHLTENNVQITAH